MKIDILMATYNGEKYLKDQIDSILNQTYKSFRLLISDDFSTDSTRDILQEYVKKDSRIIVFLQDKNLGVTKNFAYLMKKVESEYFMFSDQDDIWQKDKILDSIKKLEETNSDLVYTDLEVVDQNLEIICDSYWKLKGFEHKPKKYNNFESLYLNNYITGSTMLVKSKWIDKILPLPEKTKYILHDYWTSLIVSKFGKMTYIEEPKVKYRQHLDNRVGSKKKSDEIDNFEDLRKLFIDVKKEHFKVFIKNEESFEDQEIKMLNLKAYDYFQYLELAENFALKDISFFWKLYRFENFNYAFENFLILTMPVLAKFLFNLRRGIKK